MAKIKLDERLEPEVIASLKMIAATQKLSMSGVIANALDAQEREQKAEILADQIENLEQSVKDIGNGIHRLIDLLVAQNTTRDERLKTIGNDMKAALFGARMSMQAIGYAMHPDKFEEWKENRETIAEKIKSQHS